MEYAGLSKLTRKFIKSLALGVLAVPEKPTYWGGRGGPLKHSSLSLALTTWVPDALQANQRQGWACSLVVERSLSKNKALPRFKYQ